VAVFPAAGEDDPFGGFGIITSGYYSVLNVASNSVLMNGSYQTGTLPKTITIPEGGAWLPLIYVALIQILLYMHSWRHMKVISYRLY
jgi:hypothetical protein